MHIFTSIIITWVMISYRSAYLTPPRLFLLHIHPHLSPHASPFSLSSLPSCPRLLHLMAVCLTLASSTEQINRSWKRLSINLLMISSFSWTHKCLPWGRLPPFGGHYFSWINKVTISRKLLDLRWTFYFIKKQEEIHCSIFYLPLKPFCFVFWFEQNNSTDNCLL